MNRKSPSESMNFLFSCLKTLKIAGKGREETIKNYHSIFDNEKREKSGRKHRKDKQQGREKRS